MVEMHDFHWRNSAGLRLRTIDEERTEPEVRVSRSPAERVYARSSESLSCSLHFSVAPIRAATLSLLVFPCFHLFLSVSFTPVTSFSCRTFLFLLSRYSLGTTRARNHTRAEYDYQSSPEVSRNCVVVVVLRSFASHRRRYCARPFLAHVCIVHECESRAQYINKPHDCYVTLGINSGTHTRVSGIPLNCRLRATNQHNERAPTDLRALRPMSISSSLPCIDEYTSCVLSTRMRAD